CSRSVLDTRQNQNSQPQLLQPPLPLFYTTSNSSTSIKVGQPLSSFSPPLTISDGRSHNAPLALAPRLGVLSAPLPGPHAALDICGLPRPPPRVPRHHRRPLRPPPPPQPRPARLRPPGQRDVVRGQRLRAGGPAGPVGWRREWLRLERRSRLLRAPADGRRAAAPARLDRRHPIAPRLAGPGGSGGLPHHHQHHSPPPPQPRRPRLRRPRALHAGAPARGLRGRVRLGGQDAHARGRRHTRRHAARPPRAPRRAGRHGGQGLPPRGPRRVDYEGREGDWSGTPPPHAPQHVVDRVARLARVEHRL
ncbi:hypothetical protein HDK77DRAFT_504152, partial [Phyllosticta capitalensis]